MDGLKKSAAQKPLACASSLAWCQCACTSSRKSAKPSSRSAATTCSGVTVFLPCRSDTWGAKTGRTSVVKHLLEDFVNRAAGGRCPPSTAPQRGICSKRPLAPTQCFGTELIRSLTPQAVMLATLRRGERTHETLRCARAKLQNC